MVYRLVYGIHVLGKLIDRKISPEQVRKVLESGEVIDEYPDDTPLPSYLVLGWIDLRPIHVVAADNHDTQKTFVITAYEPDPDRWETGFKRKKET